MSLMLVGVIALTVCQLWRTDRPASRSVVRKNMMKQEQNSDSSLKRRKTAKMSIDPARK